MRRIAVLTGLLAAFAALTTSVPAYAQGSRILSVTHPSGDPGLIDVFVTDVEYDVRSGVISVTGTVACNAESVNVYVIDYLAMQTRGDATTTGTSYTESNACNESFRSVIEAEPGGTFLPGRATLQVAASACGAGCTVEVVEVEVLLVPEPATP
jgi:hypothetical protein